MKVYVVEYGEQYEGGTVRSVHASREGAEVASLALIDDSPWWCADGPDRWVAGCDYISITEHEVLP